LEAILSQASPPAPLQKELAAKPTEDSSGQTFSGWNRPSEAGLTGAVFIKDLSRCFVARFGV